MPSNGQFIIGIGGNTMYQKAQVNLGAVQQTLLLPFMGEGQGKP